MTPAQAVAQAKKGALLPVYLVIGEERLVRDEVISELRQASLAGGVAAFNEDRFTAGEGSVDAVIAAARTVPMMARRRFVLVRSIERWDSAASAAAPETSRGSTRHRERAEGSDAAVAPLDRLAEYAAAPVESTCLVVAGSKLDGRRKLVAAARKQGFWVGCDPLDDRALPAWIVERCAAKGHTIAREVADLLAAVAGPQLSSVDDAIERLSLYVGRGAAIDEDAVSECIARVRTADTWALVDAVGARDLASALRTLSDAYDPRERGLPLLGALAWSIRQLARFQAERAAGASADEAARQAGVYNGYRARELANKARTIRVRDVERWMLVLAEADLALKGSRRSADQILEEMLTRLCA
ncbi:MAG: DNA polymerase III subunit delta [Myxococcales bacterium]|nr:DNA polymerase III subunit delta [Myxococcales bacterium]